MKKVLCPTDFSASAQNAIAYAARLAQVVEAEVTLFHVQSALGVPKAVTGEYGLNIESVNEMLESQRLEIGDTFHVPCQMEVSTSTFPLAKIIGEKASAYDLVVMGTNGPDSIYQYITGSNAYKTSQESSVPVLFIPNGYRYREIKNVVFAFDYFRERKLPLLQLKPWIKSLHCQLSILQVMEESYSEEAEDELKGLQFIAKTLYAEDLTLDFHTLHAGNIPQSIQDYVLKSQADLLALCVSHKRNPFHISLTKSMTNVLQFPLLLFHE